MLSLQASFRPQNGHLIAHCHLIGSRTLASQTEPQITTHFTAGVRLSAVTHSLAIADFERPHGPSVSADEIYATYFHGPAYRVLEQAWFENDRVIGKLQPNLPNNHLPVGSPLLMSPRLIELCFQTAGLWEIEEHRRMGLPLHLDCIRVDDEAQEGQETYAEITRGRQPGTFDARVVNSTGKVLVVLEGYKTVAIPMPGDAALLKPLLAQI